MKSGMDVDQKLIHKLAEIIESALERHGVDTDKFEGTLDDAQACYNAVIESLSTDGRVIGHGGDGEVFNP